MTGDLDAGDWQPSVGSNGQSAVEERRAGQDPEEDAAPEIDDQHDPFGVGDFLALIASIVILAFGIW